MTISTITASPATPCTETKEPSLCPTLWYNSTAMKYKLAIFDLDGTILDTLEDLADSTNFTLAKHGMPPRTLDEIRAFVGNGIRNLILKAVPCECPDELIEEIQADFTAHYKVNCVNKTRPYAGIIELLKELRGQGVLTAVVSNKPDYGVKTLVELHFKGLFDASVGERPEFRRKPAPDSVNFVLETLGVAKEDAVYIGDSDVDVATAANSGLPCIAVEWGFRSRAFLEAHGAKLIVSSPEEVKKVIL